MRMMKKKLWILSLILVVVMLTACGSQSREVPEREILDIVEMLSYENAIGGAMYRDYEVTHSWDPKSNRDTVQLKVTYEYEYGYLVVEGECSAQYDKATDLWNWKTMGPWKESIDYGDKLQRAVFTGTDEFENITYRVLIESIDFDSGKVVWNYTIKGTSTGHYDGFELSGNEETDIGIPTDTYTVTNGVGGAKEIPYLFLSKQYGDMVFILDFTVRGAEYVSFWIL